MADVSQRTPSLLEHAISKVGVYKGARVCAFIVQWTIASNALGREISLAEYAEWWREQERTAYNHQREFRQAFPPLQTPQPLADLALVKQAALARGVQGIATLPANLVVA